MKRTVLDVEAFISMLEVGGNRLSENAEYVNSLNVFPVPDGDTGTNMNLTYTSGIERGIKQHSDTVGELGEDLAKGLLMGARGNSGVILSQLFRGFAKAIEGKTTIEAQDLANAFQRGIDTAVKAVMKPVEGTILTVARDSAAAGMQKAEQTDDIIEVMTAVLEEAQTSMDETVRKAQLLVEEEKSIVRMNQRELQEQLLEMQDSNLYKNLIEERRKKTENANPQNRAVTKELSKAVISHLQNSSKKTAGVMSEIKVNPEYFEKTGRSMNYGNTDAFSDEVKVEKADVKVNLDSEYFKRKQGGTNGEEK